MVGVGVGVGVGGRMGNRRWANAEFCAGEATDERGSLLWAVMLNDWHAHTHTHTHTPHSGSCVCVCVCVYLYKLSLVEWHAYDVCGSVSACWLTTCLRVTMYTNGWYSEVI